MAKTEQAAGVTANELLTPAQVHASYGFHPQTLANWRWMGEGPDYIKTSPGKAGRIFYRRSAIEAWLADHTINPAEDLAARF